MPLSVTLHPAMDSVVNVAPDGLLAAPIYESVTSVTKRSEHKHSDAVAIINEYLFAWMHSHYERWNCRFVKATTYSAH